ncbi:hypothetical protein B0A79_22730 [Flavobacterium piscis]|uniref:Protein NO VEIN C-terminal domain-containing protein n=1 Tax=Flavobacterium piscis TaxID=1114874 RepID=A0ABX2XFN8_9FLAO|nr:DUF3883 domain-containing protein [Flavobacterium piscis]OCB71211.1 hypothetical protein FLP_17015 [Flavobacterium piscis]OXE96649.1 hypothetical protein B0A79_22730 [Flavobacterium piscis]
MIEIYSKELEFINDLSKRSYTGNTMNSNSSEEERIKFRLFKKKLKSLAEYFKNQFNDEFGEFTFNASSGNPIKFNGTKLNRVWSGIFKGAQNKQYSAQISFVVNEQNKSIDLGFYFGRASSRGQSPDLERLQFLGNTLSSSIKSNIELRKQYEDLIDFGFQPISANNKVDSENWLNIIASNPQDCQLVYKLEPNENGIIDLTILTLYVKMLMFIMALIPSEGTEKSIIKYSYLTPEQRAKQAERKALIGLKGEKFIIQNEIKRLTKLNIKHNKYLFHMSLISDSFGYDIKSCDKNENHIFIEVKTTTRKKGDYQANRFYISNFEFEFYKNNKDNYKLFRVYDIDDSPEFDEIEMEEINLIANSYIVEI